MRKNPFSLDKNRRRLDDRRGLAEALFYLGAATHNEGDMATARTATQESVGLYQTVTASGHVRPIGRGVVFVAHLNHILAVFWTHIMSCRCPQAFSTVS